MVHVQEEKLSELWGDGCTSTIIPSFWCRSSLSIHQLWSQQGPEPIPDWDRFYFFFIWLVAKIQTVQCKKSAVSEPLPFLAHLFLLAIKAEPPLLKCELRSVCSGMCVCWEFGWHFIVTLCKSKSWVTFSLTSPPLTSLGFSWNLKWPSRSKNKFSFPLSLLCFALLSPFLPPPQTIISETKVFLKEKKNCKNIQMSFKFVFVNMYDIPGQVMNFELLFPRKHSSNEYPHWCT